MTTISCPELGPVAEPRLTVALIAPDIPQNTGNIARLCLVTGSRLVLVRPLGFRLTDSQLERAGMDYWKRLQPLVLDDLEAFAAWSAGRRVFLLSARGTRNYAEVVYQPGDVLCLGSEGEGLPAELVQAALSEDRVVRLPMLPGMRCLNVSSTAAVIVYEALRQLCAWHPPPHGP